MKISGNVVVIGIDDKLELNKYLNNKNIKFIEFLSCDNKEKNTLKASKKTVKVDKLQKRYKNKNINFTIIDFNKVKNNKIMLIHQSLLFTQDEIILKNPTEFILKYYSTYKVNIKDNRVILKNKNIKFKYLIKNIIEDSYNKIIDIISM